MEGSRLMRPRRQPISEAEAAEVPQHEHRTVCPLLTHDKWSLSEKKANAVAPPMKAYKLGKERWSYNQLRVEIHDSERGMRLDPKLAKTIDPKKLPVKQQGYSAAFDIEFSNSSRVKVTFFICYSVPRRIQTDSGPKYEWDLVTRDHCKNGCPGPILRPIQRLGKLGKRSNVPRAEAADPNQTKDPKFVYLSIDECGSHVGSRKTTFFRLVVGAYEVCGERETLLGTTCSEPFTVVRNNDNTEGASYSPIQIPIRHTWTGWGLGPVQMGDLPRVHLPAAVLPRSPGTSTSPLSAASMVPLYDGSWAAPPARMDQLAALARRHLQQQAAPAQHNGFTHLDTPLEGSCLHSSVAAAVVQTGAGTLPLPAHSAYSYAQNDSATSGPCRWGGAARRTGRGRAPAGSPRAHRADFAQGGISSACAENFHHGQHNMMREASQQELMAHMGPHSHSQHVHVEYEDFAHLQPHPHSADATMEAQYTGFKRMRPIATQQSETAEEFRFMLPEQSQEPMLKRARIMDEDHSGLPFACLPAAGHHALSYASLAAQHGSPSMPFAQGPLPIVDEVAPPASSLAQASQAEREASQHSVLPASAPPTASAAYAAHSYHDHDKEGNVESLQTMLSDPESLAPAMPLDISFPHDQASNNSRVVEAPACAYHAISTMEGPYAHAGHLPAEVLQLPRQFLLSAQYLSAQAAGLAPLQTSGSGNRQDSWAAQSNTPSAGETSISDFMPGPSSVQGQLSIQEEEFVDNILRQEPAGDC